MTRRFFLVTSLILALIGSYSSNLFAQGLPKRTAVVPFTFLFEGTSLPAGTYEVEIMDSGMVLLLNTKQATIEGEAATLPLPMGDTASPPELMFVKSSSGYTLLEIRTEQARALVTSQYGHPKFSSQQLRTVPITSAMDQSGANTRQVSTQGR
jgi:hypothetical protein